MNKFKLLADNVPSIEFGHIDHNIIDLEKIQPIFYRTSKVEEVAFNDVAFSLPDEVNLSPLESLNRVFFNNNLKSLEISSDYIEPLFTKEEDIKGLTGIISKCQLRSLRITQSYADETMNAKKPLDKLVSALQSEDERLNNLESLMIRFGSISDEGMIQLSEVISQKSLSEFELMDSEASPEAVETLVSNLPKTLTKITISYVKKINAKEIESLASIIKSDESQLSEIKLTSCNITNDGAKKLLDAIRDTKVTELDLYHNQDVAPETLAEISEELRKNQEPDRKRRRTDSPNNSHQTLVAQAVANTPSQEHGKN